MTIRSFIMAAIVLLLYGGEQLHAQRDPCDSTVHQNKYYLLFLQNGPDLDATAAALRSLGYTALAWDNSPLSWFGGVGWQSSGKFGLFALEGTFALGDGGGRYSDTVGRAYTLDADLLHFNFSYLYGYPLFDTDAFTFYPLAGLGFAFTDLAIRRRFADMPAREGEKSLTELVGEPLSESISRQRLTVLAEIGVGIESRFNLSSADARDRTRLLVGFRGG